MCFLAHCFMLFSKNIVTLQPESQHFRADRSEPIDNDAVSGLTDIRFCCMILSFNYKKQYD